MPQPPSFRSSIVRSAAVVATAVGVLASGCLRPGEPVGSGAAVSSPPASSVAPVATAASDPAAHADTGSAWQHAANDAQVDAAFATARQAGRPVFVYWGAKWCPPCNQVKATLFNRQDFIERSRAFVPVYIDGDSPGAQKLGARFHVAGYPTMVLFNPQGAEVTRLPGEVEPERYTEVLTLGMNAARPVRDLLTQALGGHGPTPLTPDDWRLLAFHAWEVDEQQTVPKARLAATLARLADACPPGQREAAMRLRLKALAAADDAGPPAVATGRSAPAAGAAPPPLLAADTRAALVAMLADPAAARRHLDVLTGAAAEIVRTAGPAGSPERAELQRALDAALKRFEADPGLSRADRIAALIAQVDLATIDRPKPSTRAPTAAPVPALPEPLLTDIRAQTARADREITDGYERQAVITACAYLLEHAGLGAESDALLKANLAKSHSPYYLMSELASNAKARGDTAEALRWYGEAYEKSEGPATRLQWGASYLNALVDLAPADEARIERTAAQVFTEAGRLRDAFDGRSGRSLQRVGAKLVGWNGGGAHAAVFGRLQARLDETCAAPPADDARREACRSVLKRPAAAKSRA